MRIWLHVFSPEGRMSEKSTMTSVYCSPTWIIVRSLYSLSIIFLSNLFICIFKWCALNRNYSVFNCLWHWLAVAVKKNLEPIKGHFPNSTDVTVQIKSILQKTQWMILPCKSLIPLRWDLGSFASANPGFRTTCNITDIIFLIARHLPIQTLHLKIQGHGTHSMKIINPLSLGIYILYNSSFMLSILYFISFSLFPLVLYLWEKTANRNRVQMQTYKEKILDRTHRQNNLRNQCDTR